MRFFIIPVMGMALLETVGVASVMPFLAMSGNPEMLETNASLQWLFTQGQRLGIATADGFVLALGLAAFVITIVSAVSRTITHYAMNRFIEMRRHSIRARLLETYLRQPYDFFLHRHSADLAPRVFDIVWQRLPKSFAEVLKWQQ